MPLEQKFQDVFENPPRVPGLPYWDPHDAPIQNTAV